MSKIFISYNHQSEAMARSLVNDTEALGHVVWFDQELSGGQAWWDQILARVRDCDVFVFVLDPKSLNSTACQREFGYADALGKPVLPVLVAEGVSTNLLPPELSRLQFIDYRKQDRNAAFSLARALGSLPPAKALPDPLPPPPEVPASYLGGLARKVDTASSLSYEEQSALVLDLRKGLRDLEAAEDARTLLKRLRIRRDLFAAIAEEIDDLLGGTRQPPAVPALTLVPKPLPEAGTPDTPPGHTETHKPTVRERLLGAFVGATVGVVIGALSYIFHYRGVWFPGAVYDGIAGAIVGAVTGTHRKVIGIALAGFVLGFSVLWMANQLPYFGSMGVPAFLGGEIGAIMGAIAGAIIGKMKGWT